MTEGHFEAIKYAYRQSKDGFVLSFVVHPSDMPDELATAAIGSRFMVAFASIADTGPQPSLTPGPAEGGAANTGASAAPPSSKNAARAVAMAQNAAFRAFVGAESVDDAEAAIKAYCGAVRKRDLNAGPPARKFANLRESYLHSRLAERADARA